ncbi:MAG: methyltransferase domain-containing protein [archaeon]
MRGWRKKIFEKIIKYIKNKEVLDLGCVGRFKFDDEKFFHMHICKYAKECVGADFDKKGLEELRKRGFKTKFIDLNKKNKPFKKFDVITAKDVIEHIPNQQNLFEFLSNSLRSGGLLVLSFPYRYSKYDYLQDVFRKKKEDKESDSPHIIFHDVHTIRRIARLVGLKIVHQEFLDPIVKSHLFVVLKKSDIFRH